MRLHLRDCDRSFQPTPSRGGRRVGDFDPPVQTPVSTHALTRRATAPGTVRPIQFGSVSTHALTRRATAHSYCTTRASRLFQPTPSRGGRHQSLQLGSTVRGVSTHALTRRATSAARPIGGQPGVSTHALTRRATACSRDGRYGYGQFQPTPSRGGRRRRPTRRRRRRQGFNPRPHAEGDPAVRCPTRPSRTFQPTPSRGGRPQTILGDQAVTAFQPTPSRGGRRSTVRLCRVTVSFQPTPSRGGRRRPKRHERWLRRFQPTPSRGGRRPGNAAKASGI